MLSLRTLNRAVLQRQLLLRRSELEVLPAVEAALGLNAQDPNLPYLALWSRLSRFAINDLTTAIEDRRLVRSTLMRATQHLVSATDFAMLRPAVAPLLRRAQRNTFGRRTEGVDLAALVRDTRALLAGGRVLSRPELGRDLAQSRPGSDPVALGWSVQYLEPLVHPAPSGTWNVRGATPYARADEWLDVPGTDRAAVRRDATLNDLTAMVRRYLAAFGPATVADVRAWSGVSGLRDVVASMRNELRTFADESGRELYDLPGAPLPSADTSAPVRFLPEFDAPLLAFHDRSRIMTDQIRRQVCVGDGVAATVLVDGTVAATWTLSDARADAVLSIQPLRRLSPTDRSDVEDEAAALLAFAAPDASSHHLRLLPT